MTTLIKKRVKQPSNTGWTHPCITALSCPSPVKLSIEHGSLWVIFQRTSGSSSQHMEQCASQPSLETRSKHFFSRSKILHPLINCMVLIWHRIQAFQSSIVNFAAFSVLNWNKIFLYKFEKSGRLTESFTWGFRTTIPQLADGTLILSQQT